MYPNREVFPEAPVALVTAEARFTDAPRLRQQETLDAVAIALEDRLPFTEPVTGMNVESLGPGVAPRLEQRHGVVLRNANNTEAITLTSSAVKYETTTYGEFDAFRRAIAAICQSLIDADVRPALKRVGLRYINEIRVPEPVIDIRAWDKWIDASLVSAPSIAPGQAPVRTAQGAVAFDLGEGAGLNVGYAALNQGSIVNLPYLRRPPFQPGPFFALDLDGFCEFGADTAVHLDAVVVADILSAVHGPIGAAFQQSITDNARDLFRGCAV